MSISRHHAEWLSLTETSGPFLSMPVLLRVFPQELDGLDTTLARRLRLAFEEWEENQEHHTPDPAIHNAWIRFVLTEALGFPAEEVLVEGQGVPDSLRVQVPAHVERLKPDMIVVVPARESESGTPRLLISTYPRSQNLAHPVDGRAWKASPATRMTDLLRGTGIKVGLVTNGEQWMLVSNCADSTGYASWFASLWREEPLTLRAFLSLLGVRRFFGVAPDDTLSALLTESASDQTEITDQLGYQVRKAVEVLVQAIDRIDKDWGRTLLHGADEKQLYEAALTTMMRLVFLFSAEERGLLPLDDDLYSLSYAASTLRAQLREAADQSGEEVLERRCDAWSRLLATFRAVYGGVQHEAMRLPAYGGNLFNPDRFPFLEGRSAGTSWRETPAQPLPIHNRTVLHLLEALQILQVKVPGGGPAEARRLSFRALDIEQIGHVYEGLLDHTAVRAEEPVLGLAGTKDREPEVPLSKLEEVKAKDAAGLLRFLHEATGRGVNALTKALAAGVGLDNEHDLHIACDNNDALYERVMPFAGLLRLDTSGAPVVITKNSVYVTAGTDRRSTGTHYTPRSLTAPIVKRTLDPLLYRGMAEGVEPCAETLRSPREILALKVCDMTTGSGAFLVQGSRYLAERLVEAWEAIEEANPDLILVTPEGDLSEGMPHERLIPTDPEERLVIARRLIVDRCLYGVDVNPMAVEMAKLSLWLVTMERQRPFTFLDHAIKCGDSLVGMDAAQLGTWSLDRQSRDALGVFTNRSIADALEFRLLLRQMEERSIVDVNEKARLHALAETAMTRAKLAADLIVAPALHYLKPADQKKERERLRASYAALDPVINDPLLRTRADEMLGRVKPFHWPLEFPEVFNGGREAGFDAIIGNPPFMGGQKITGEYGVPYREYLVNVIGHGVKGSADIVAYFHLRGFELVRPGGIFGLIATNTIAQGDSREVGLDQIIAGGGQIIEAIPSMKWPGVANLEIAVTSIYVGDWKACRKLNGRCVDLISAFLDDGLSSGNPLRLKENANIAFKGVEVNGMGFVLEPVEANALISKDARNKEVMFPYLNGDDLNSRPDQSASRWVINFNGRELENAEKYYDCMKIVHSRVKPERDINADRNLRQNWWKFKRPAPELAKSTIGLSKVLVRSSVSNIHSIAFVDTGIICSHATIVFASSSLYFFVLIQSSIHTIWLTLYSSSMRTDTRYTPSDCFETFPFPAADDAKQQAELERIGEAYYEHRRVLMLTRQIGLTKAYNLFHDPACTDADIAELRRLHAEMDTAVRDAYGWQDLPLGHGFYGDGKETRFTLAPAAKQEVLRRLLKLNLECAAEEAAEVAAAVPVKKARKGKAVVGQTSTDDLMIEAIVADKTGEGKAARLPKAALVQDEDIEPSILAWLVARENAPELVERFRPETFVPKTYKPDISPLHSTRLAKEEYSLQKMAGIPVGASYRRANWGPLSESFYNAVRRAEELGWLIKTSDGRSDSYRLGPNAAAGIEIAAKVLGDRMQQAEDILRYMDGDRTLDLEQQATVHKVWDDLKAAGMTANQEAVVRGVQAWKPDRKGFTSGEIRIALKDLSNRGLLKRSV